MTKNKDRPPRLGSNLKKEKWNTHNGVFLWRFYSSVCRSRSVVSTFFSSSAFSEVLSTFSVFPFTRLTHFSEFVSQIVRYAVLGAGFAGLSVTWNLLKVRLLFLCLPSSSSYFFGFWSVVRICSSLWNSTFLCVVDERLSLRFTIARKYLHLIRLSVQIVGKMALMNISLWFCVPGLMWLFFRIFIFYF